MNTIYILLLEAEKAVDQMRGPIDTARKHLVHLREQAVSAARGSVHARARLRCLAIQSNLSLITFTMGTTPSDDTAAAAAPGPRPRT